MDDHLAVIVAAGGIPDDATIAHLMRFAQWALDEAAHNLLGAEGVTPERLRELADSLEAVAGLLRARSRRVPG